MDRTERGEICRIDERIADRPKDGILPGNGGVGSHDLLLLAGF